MSQMAELSRIDVRSLVKSLANKFRNRRHYNPRSRENRAIVLKVNPIEIQGLESSVGAPFPGLPRAKVLQAGLVMQ